MNYFQVIPKDIIFQLILYIDNVDTFVNLNDVMNNTLNNIDSYIYILSNKYVIKGKSHYDNTFCNMNLYQIIRNIEKDDNIDYTSKYEKFISYFIIY